MTSDPHPHPDLDDLPPDHPVRRTWDLYQREGLTPRVRAWCERVREVADGGENGADRPPVRVYEP